MNRTCLRRPELNNSPAAPGGFALVIVLGVLVLLIALVVGLLTRATTERTAASGFRNASSARQFADSAVSLIQGQINIASTQGTDVAWASQPGMIRTFNSTGGLLNAYKLYSADNMVATSANLVADLPPPDWNTTPGIWTDLNAPVSGSYPILDPSSNAEGFKLAGAPVATTPGANLAPMPVRWLYVLRDGSMVAPVVSGSQVIVAGESRMNPIEGRVAFWTDDESCKVNINTASEGNFWDVPRVNSEYERDQLANYQPAQKEFQRYPGHPAMTSLSTVFPTLSANQIFALAPRVTGGGSNSGTALATAPLTPDNDRLYSSMDELMFTPGRTNNGVTRQQLEYSKFFLTAQSRAPETNLFNLPRIACWPVFKGLASGKVTAFDKLIALCASTGVSTSFKAYYFQRENADGPNDIAIPRNLELYGYLQYLTGKAIPGFGGSFSGKYGNDNSQILTEIFDYIRCTNLYDDNLSSPNQFTDNRFVSVGHGWVVPSRHPTNGTAGFGRFYTVSELGIGFICNAAADNPATAADESNGSNKVPPDPMANTVLGGVPLAAGEKYIQAIIVPEFFCPMMGYTEMRADMKFEISGLENLTIAGRNLGFPASTTTYYRNAGVNIHHGRSFGGNPSWRFFTDADKGSPGRGNLAADSGSNNYPFIGVPVKISAPPTGGTMAFNGGDITLKIYAGATTPPSAATLIQTINIRLPAATLPVPNIVTTGAGGSPATSRENWWAFSKRGAINGFPGRMNFTTNDPGNAATPFAGAFFRSEDVVRTVLPSHGDYRLVAGRRDVPNSVFVKHPYYNDTAQRFASNLSGPIRTDIEPGFDTRGRYIASLDYASAFVAPDIPYGASQTPENSGDYDNSLPGDTDGPFINKPDEGNNYRGAAGTGIPYFQNSHIQTAGGPTFFSPNRQMPSPGMFGSLPTGVLAGEPWRTLLFRPQTSHPSYVDPNSSNASNRPSDHLILDLFWMPVVEPYAISDRFSTSGKINLNYQIVPFTYLERSTAVRALLKAEKVSAIPNSAIYTYKIGVMPGNPFRRDIDAKETLQQLDAKFATGNVFRSPSEICDMHIVPAGQTASGMPAFWKNHALTGDNMRERIYTTLYPRLTTKSNTYTVHFRAQALRRNPASSPEVWKEGKDIVTGEYRGSTTIERFIDANNPDLPDYAANPASIGTLFATLDKFYKWRVLANRQFAP